jgi:intracellular septation protein
MSTTPSKAPVRARPKPPAWLRIAIDYGALLAFIAAVVLRHGIDEVATIVLMVGSVLAVAIGWLIERRLAPLPLMSAIFSLVFGGLTLIFHDKNILKMKLTFFEGAMALAMVGGLALGRNPLKALLGDTVKLPDAAWRTLTIRYAGFFAVAAIANEIVWRNTSDVTWAWFKGGVGVAAVLFSVTQTPFLMKHMQTDAPDPVEPPDTGF